MTGRRAHLLAVTLCAVPVAACSSMSIHEKAVLVAPTRPPSSEECPVRFFAPNAPDLKQCRVVAQIALVDTGFTRTSRCGTQSVRSTIRRIACEYDANVAVTSRISNPASTCAETDASLYRCDPAVLPREAFPSDD
ncbi:hypothetical protein K2X89_06295 [Myxococcota bacterium]|nr:hypothetical protein [Myxococcota bacterium]